jgi:hypothetical protein
VNNKLADLRQMYTFIPITERLIRGQGVVHILRHQMSGRGVTPLMTFDDEEEGGLSPC